jgi:hypothetical protein
MPRKCRCKCHTVAGAEATPEAPVQERKPRKKSDKPPSAAQLANWERMAEQSKKRAALKKEHPDWSKSQLNEAIGWGKK